MIIGGLVWRVKVELGCRQVILEKFPKILAEELFSVAPERLVTRAVSRYQDLPGDPLPDVRVQRTFPSVPRPS